MLYTPRTFAHCLTRFGQLGNVGDRSMTENRVTIAIADGVADVRLDRADRSNALDIAMFEALAEAATALSGNRAVRSVVLSGNGRGFCAGIDTSALAGEAALKDLMPRTHGDANLFQASVWNWRRLDVPVIAAVHGYAFGGGLQLILGADVRIVTPDAKLSIMEARYGLIPDMAGIALLRHLVREDVARELTYSGRIIDGGEALQLGLATRVADDPHAAAMALAAQFAAGSRPALVAAKRLFNRAADDAATAATLLRAEAEEQAPLLAGEDHREAIAAAAERRPPRFGR